MYKDSENIREESLHHQNIEVLANCLHEHQGRRESRASDYLIEAEKQLNKILFFEQN